MSMPLKTTVACSKCYKKYAVTIYNSINTSFSEDVHERIMNGDLFHSYCPHCGFNNYLEYDILYNDMNKEAMIWVVNPVNSDYEKRLCEIQTMKLPFPATTRVVNSTKELREKVHCLYSGRDDRVIELCKQFLRIQLCVAKPEFECVASYYAFENKGIVFFYDDEGNELISELDDKLYSLMEEFFVTLQQKEGLFALYDSNWAEQIFPDFLEYVEKNIESVESEQEPDPQIVVREKPPIRFCRICGERLLDNSQFCSYCGTKVWVDESEGQKGVPMNE